MNLTDDLPSRWPIPASFSSSKSKPLSFTPSPLSYTLLLSSLSLSPNLPPPFPRLSLSSFLSPSLPPSTSSALARSLEPSLPSPPLLLNSLCLLRRPRSPSLLAFFPSGDNADRVGFIALSVDGSRLVGDNGTKVRVSDGNHGQRIVKLAVTPYSGNLSFGFLMACTMYGVRWYSVELGRNGEPLLAIIGCKVFKTCGVVDACWNPHLREESLVLLESGELFLFDVEGSSSGKRLKVLWKDWSSLGEGGWLGCEFCWHPEILVVAHSSAVFQLDFRETECVVTCLLEIETSAMHTRARKDRFVAFAKAGSEHHRFVVVSECRVVLLDVRKALMPLLQWAHDIPSPSYVNVFPLSQLRAYSEDDDGSKGSYDDGKCIVMGSFWNCEFNIFCYGPPQTNSVVSEISKYDDKVCAWDTPSELMLSGRECSCGSCLVREEFWKDSLPPWIDWRQKKEIVLGFGILDKDLDAELSQQGGFTVIRLMSSGKIESQRYIPSRHFVKTCKEPFKKSVFNDQDTLLFNDCELEYKFPKRFHYQKLDYLSAYMKDDLDKALFEKIKEHRKVSCESDYISSVDFHQSVCEKLKTLGISKPSNAVSNMVKHTRLMSSVHEIALSKIWTHFPSDLLQGAFSYYSQVLEVLLDNKKVSLEFLDIPRQPQYPPFVFREPSRRSSKWTRKVRRGTAFVGPVLPTPALLTICELRKEENLEFSANSEIRNQCNEVMKVATSGSDFCDGPAVSLGDDGDDPFGNIENMNLILLHKVVPKSYEDAMLEDPLCYDDKFTTFICKKSEETVSKTKAKRDGLEMFDSLSPIELKFDAPVESGTDANMSKKLKSRYSNFLQNFDPYQQYLEKNGLPKTVFGDTF